MCVNLDLCNDMPSVYRHPDDDYFEFYPHTYLPALPAFPLPLFSVQSLSEPLPGVRRPRSLSFLEEKDEKFDSRAVRRSETRSRRSGIERGRQKRRRRQQRNGDTGIEEEELELIEVAASSPTNEQEGEEEDFDEEVISPTALIALRQTFLWQCEKGRLKQPVIHVHFTHPKTLSECWNCADSDCLWVSVGLTNIFILQFAVVVLLFFAHKEIVLGDFDNYYPGHYRGGT